MEEGMHTSNSVKVTYWAFPDGPASMIDLKDIEEFRKELEDNYVAAVHGRRSDSCGGGLYELVIELISNVSMADAASWLISGVAFDVLKHGANSLIIRPLLSAYQKLKEKNKEHGVTIGELRIVLRDSILIIYNICEDGIFDNLKGILEAVAKHYSKTVLRSGEGSYEIHVPVLEDTSEGRLIRFRVLLDVDETIVPVVPAAYYNYWGLWFDRSCQSRVFDVSADLLLDEEFFTKERYWAEWEFRYAKTWPKGGWAEPGGAPDRR
jgi:hypothetical protein